MNKSESIEHLAKALNQFQGEVGAAHKDADNPFFKSKYADLNAYLKAIKDPLFRNGLSIVQSPGMVSNDNGDFVKVDTTILHESGHWLSGSASAPLVKKDAQGVGSTISYLRRYSLAAMLNLGATDDDGETAVVRGSASQDRQFKNAGGMNMDTLAILETAIKVNAVPKSTLDGWLKRAGIDSISDFTEEQATKIINSFSKDK